MDANKHLTHVYSSVMISALYILISVHKKPRQTYSKTINKSRFLLIKLTEENNGWPSGYTVNVSGSP